MSRILNRIDKLLRLADPSTNANVHERTAAAIKIVELILQHRLQLREVPGAGTGASLATTIDKDTRRFAELRKWRPAVAARDGVCLGCGQAVIRGDVVLTRFRLFEAMYRHEHCLSGI